MQPDPDLNSNLNLYSDSDSDGDSNRKPRDVTQRNALHFGKVLGHHILYNISLFLT